MSNEFVWTDELAQEFCEYVGLRVGKKEDIRQQIKLLQGDFKASNQPKESERLPIGIIPFWMYNEQRLDEINSAILRYNEAGKEIPKEWIGEKQSLEASLQDEISSKYRKKIKVSHLWCIGDGVYKFVVNRDFGTLEYAAVMGAIESVLNGDNDDCANKLMMIDENWKGYVEAIKKHQPYTEKDLENAFNSGRIGKRHKTFQDYLKTIQ